MLFVLVYKLKLNCIEGLFPAGLIACFYGSILTWSLK